MYRCVGGFDCASVSTIILMGFGNFCFSFNYQTLQEIRINIICLLTYTGPYIYYWMSSHSSRRLVYVLWYTYIAFLSYMDILHYNQCSPFCNQKWKSKHFKTNEEIHRHLLSINKAKSNTGTNIIKCVHFFIFTLNNTGSPTDIFIIVVV